MFKETKYPAESAKFALWLNSDPEALAALVKLGVFPADQTAGDKVPAFDEGLAFFGDQPIYKDFLEIGKTNGAFTWGPTMTQTFADVSDGFTNSLAGKGSLADGLKYGQDQTVKALKAAGIPASE